MDNLASIMRNFSKKKIAVIGDLILDKYIYGDVSRISPEAPVPVLKAEKDVYDLGAAANVASNISSLQGKATIFGFIGDDEAGKIMKNLMEERAINHFLDSDKKTTLKIRPIGRRQQIMRIDYENTNGKIFSSKFKEYMKKELDNSDMIVISDYAKGTITQDLMNFLKNYGDKIIIDPKPENKSLYKGAFLITPNEKEALAMSSKKDLKSAGEYLREQLNSNILVTRGEKGMTLFSEKELEIPTYAKEIFDVTGAGDTVVSTLALSLASGSSLEDAAILANHSASIAVSRAGTYAVELNELERKILGEERKLKNLGELKKEFKNLKRKGKIIVWTNGCFDILHEGHVNYLKKAKQLGDYLVVGLNSDDSVRKLKGPRRPVRPEQARAEILSSIKFIDYLLVFPETSVEKYLSALEPDIYVKAEDYTLKSINQEERKAVENYRGQIKFIPIEEKISSTEIIETIKHKQ